MASTSKQQEPIPITSLDPQQLMSIKSRMEEEVQSIATSAMQLQKAAQLFQASKEAVESLSSAEEGQTVMLPLTPSLYVNGNVASTDKVLVDVGTGYFVEMSSEQGADHFNRKVTKLKGNLDELSQAMREKRNQMMVLNQVLNEKMASMQAGKRKPQPVI